MKNHKATKMVEEVRLAKISPRKELLFMWLFTPILLEIFLIMFNVFSIYYAAGIGIYGIKFLFTRLLINFLVPYFVLYVCVAVWYILRFKELRYMVSNLAVYQYTNKNKPPIKVILLKLAYFFVSQSLWERIFGISKIRVTTNPYRLITKNDIFILGVKNPEDVIKSLEHLSRQAKPTIAPKIHKSTPTFI